MTTATDETREIEAVHAAWFQANIGLQIEKMIEQFPEGEAYLQYNLNGLTYRGVHDKAKLWAGLQRVGSTITSIEESDPIVVHVEGDTAWIAGEAVAQIVLTEASGAPTVVPFRYTEIYRKDDNAGNPRWTIWHMHCSPAAPEGTLKYGDE
ncbi:YybH family protein [Nocardia carnea]|uniref:YybH family protein n=1 Tax=Nocardia carnea TaxID=37328 RepID=UPI00245630EA|nr:nuclear transport factor 2 family protein [Nocardia carnea]